MDSSALQGPLPPGFYTVKADDVVSSNIRWVVVDGPYKNRFIFSPNLDRLLKVELNKQGDGRMQNSAEEFSEGEALRHSVLAEPQPSVGNASPIKQEEEESCYTLEDMPSRQQHDPLGITPFEEGEDEIERARRLR